MKNLVSSYTWLLYSGEVRVGVGTKSRICCVGWVVYLHHPSYITHSRSRTHSTSYVPTVYNPHKSSVAVYEIFHLWTWKWPMKRAETCSCSLCNKLYMSLPSYSCVRQVYTLQSSLSASCPGSFTTRKIYFFASWFGCEVSLRSGLKDKEKRVSDLCLGSNLESSVVQPVAYSQYWMGYPTE